MADDKNTGRGGTSLDPIQPEKQGDLDALEGQTNNRRSGSDVLKKITRDQSSLERALSSKEETSADTSDSRDLDLEDWDEDELENFFKLDDEGSAPKIDQKQELLGDFRDKDSKEEAVVKGGDLGPRVDEEIADQETPRPQPERTPEEERIERIKKEQEEEAVKIQAEKQIEEERKAAETAEAKRKEEEKIEGIKKMIEEIGQEQERLGGALEDLQEETAGVEDLGRMDSFEKATPGTTATTSDDQQQRQAQLAQIQGDIRKILRYQSPEEQVAVLTQISEEKGPVYAIELAEKLVNNNYVLDEVHGNLTGLRELLIAKGFLKEIR